MNKTKIQTSRQYIFVAVIAIFTMISWLFVIEKKQLQKMANNKESFIAVTSSIQETNNTTEEEQCIKNQECIRDSWNTECLCKQADK